MGERQIVNRILWHPDSVNAYSLGSKIIFQDDIVKFHNQLMAPGDPIMAWSSANNYQMTKLVPQLPILQHRLLYRIVVHASVYPKQTALFRLNFYDNQGQKVDQQYSNELSFTFTYPDQAVRYDLAIINAGCTDLKFRSIEICLDSIPKEANMALWKQPRIGQTNDGLNILLILAGKHDKKNYPELQNYSDQYCLWPIVVEPESVKAVAPLLNDYLSSLNSLTNVCLVSTHPDLDDSVTELCYFHSELMGLITDKNQMFLGQKIRQYHQTSPSNWQNSTLYDPQWSTIIPALPQKKEGEHQ